jgi:hypothetical protein
MRTLLSACLAVALALAARAAASDDGTAKSPPLPAGAAARLGDPTPQQQDAATAVAFAPDGKTIAWATSAKGTVTVHVWNVADRKEVCHAEFTGDAAYATTPLVFAPDGKSVAVGT